MNPFTVIFVIIFMALAITALTKRIKVPQVVGLLLLGLLLKIPVLHESIVAPHRTLLTVLGDIGLLAIMFLAGLNSSWDVLNHERKDAAVISVFASILPFLLGYFLGLLLRFGPVASLILGMTISITAEGTTAKVLYDLRKLKSRVGAAIMGAGIIDDIFGFSLFLVVTFFLKEVYVREDLFIAGAILFFFLGIIAQRAEKFRILEEPLVSALVPFFFVSVAIEVVIADLSVDLLLTFMILAVAVAGKVYGALMAHPFTDFSMRQLYLIGWGLNSRGAVGMALGLIAFRSGLIPVSLYSSLVIVVLVTTLTFPFVISAMIKRYPAVMR